MQIMIKIIVAGNALIYCLTLPRAIVFLLNMGKEKRIVPSEYKKFKFITNRRET